MTASGTAGPLDAAEIHAQVDRFAAGGLRTYSLLLAIGVVWIVFGYLTDGIFLEQGVAVLRDEHGVHHEVRHARLLDRVGDGLNDRRRGQHAGLRGIDADVGHHRSHLVGHDVGPDLVVARDPLRVLHRHRGDRRHPVHAATRERLQIGLNPRAASRIGGGDRHRRCGVRAAGQIAAQAHTDGVGQRRHAQGELRILEDQLQEVVPRHEALGLSSAHPRWMATALCQESILVYPVSSWIDADLLRISGLRPNQYIEIYNVSNGERFSRGVPTRCSSWRI